MPFRATATAFSKKNTKTPPPEETGMESTYLKALGEKQTPVTVRLLSGETFRGWIQYYDVSMVRLTPDNGHNLFIFKHEIMYIAEDGGRRSRGRGRGQTLPLPWRTRRAQHARCASRRP